MPAEAIYTGPAEETTIVAPAALASGEVIQLPSGRAAVVMGLKAVAAGDLATVATEGRFRLPKTASVAMLRGGRAFWDRSASKVHFKADNGDFYIGVVDVDAAATDTEVTVNLNVQQANVVELDGLDSPFSATIVKTAGSPAVSREAVGAGYRATLDSTAEAQKLDILSGVGIPIADGPIFETRLAIYDIGNNAALDINFGLANATHATDFDSTTIHVAFHMDGNSLNIMAQSKDGVTTVAGTTDTTVDAVDDTFAEFWIDARDPADVKLYINGVRVLSSTAFKLDGATQTTALLPIVHVEKTSNATTADVRVNWLRARSTDLAA